MLFLKKWYWCILLYTFTSMAIAFHDANGRFIPDTTFKNKWIIVNYWADWCDTCLEEIPELNNFFKNSQSNDVIILGVNYDRLPAPILRQVITKAGIMFPVLQEDPANHWRLGEVTALPTTFIINPNGDVVRKIIGPNTEQSLMKVVQNRIYSKKSVKQTKSVG